MKPCNSSSNMERQPETPQRRRNVEKNSPQSSKSSAESTAAMFSGKKRDRSSSTITPKKKYMSVVNWGNRQFMAASARSRLDFDN